MAARRYRINAAKRIDPATYRSRAWSCNLPFTAIDIAHIPGLRCSRKREAGRIAVRHPEHRAMNTLIGPDTSSVKPVVRGPSFAVDSYMPISCADTTELSQQVRDWSFEFSQLSAGTFAASGGMVPLDCALVARATIDQTLLHRGCSPRGSVAIIIPGRGSGRVFVRDRELGPGQCVAMADGACLDAITRGRYVHIALAIDLDAWSTHSHWLSECPLATARGIGIESPGPARINSMLDTVEWIFTTVSKHPAALRRGDVRASLTDQFLAAVGRFSTRAMEYHSRSARAHRRIAVERAREYIDLNLSEPLRLSELCRHAHVQARCLEYGFRETTGLSPIAYIKSLRLNGVRKSLLRRDVRERSISEIALDQGFWHLSQFSVDYRKFFGETPSATRQRALAALRAEH